MFEFFDYKWRNDLLMAIDDDFEIALLNQLPEHVQNKLVSHYLFKNFQMKFLDFFRLESGESQSNFFSLKTPTFYTWVDQEYRNYMMFILQHLEPFYEKKNSIIVDEFDEFDLIHFIHKGTVRIGFEVNKVRKYCI